MNYRILVCALLILPSMVSAMQIYPLGVQQQAKKRWCECLRSCFKTQAQRDAQEREAELQRQDEERKVDAERDRLEQKRRAKRLTMNAKSQDLRNAFNTKQQTQHAADIESNINKVKVAKTLYVTEDVMAAARAATPLGLSLGLLPPLSPNGELTARPSASTSARESVLPQQSPTPAPHVVVKVAEVV